MDIEHITNESLMNIDYARKERIEFLKKISSRKHSETVYLAPGLNTRAIWMSDISVTDRRSVKAQLASRGDYRVLWWSLNCALHRLLNPKATLEQQMFAFHQRQHRWTIARLTRMRNVQIVHDVMQRQGIFAGLRHAFEHM
jgi:hypothetical protein